MKLTPEQQYAVDVYNLPDTKLLLIDSVAGSGKEQPLTSMIQTPTGQRLMGDISIGDTILHPFNGTSTVTNINPQGIKQVYLVEFLDGTSAECGADHLWTVSSSNWITGTKEVTTRELLSNGLRNTSNMYKYRVPMPDPIQYNQANLPINPYLLGSLIADGAISNNRLAISYHIDDTFIPDKLSSMLPDGNSFSKPRHTSANGLQSTINSNGSNINPIRNQLVDLELNVYSRDRFIPAIYLYSSIEQRQAILAGLMDCDGSAGQSNRITYSTSSKQLADDVISLVQSLSGLATIVKPDTRKQHTNYTIIIKFDSYNPFTIPRKRDRITARKQNLVHKTIKSITQTDRFVEQQCITVSEPDGLYMTDNYIVTHNSHTLINIANLLHITSGRCIVYNKSVSDENKIVFPDHFDSSTIHSLAYQSTVKEFKLKVGFFNPRDIKDKIGWEFKVATVEMLRQFCLSKYLKINDFAKEVEMNSTVQALVSKYIGKMKSGEIEVTHDFYMKFFHMLLANKIIVFEELDSLMLDECQDSFACTIEIFKLIPAKKKIAVGDQNQALYSFNYCINGFHVLESEPGAVTVSLNTTFRVNVADAKLVQAFMRDHLGNPNYSFIGNNHADTEIKSRAYLTKTNSALIGKMIQLMDKGRGFRLLRSVTSIFELLLILLSLKKGGFIKNPEFRHLQVEVDTWHNSRAIKAQFNSPLGYIASVHSNDVTIKTAVRIIIDHGPEKIFDVYKYAKSHSSGKNHEWTLSTVFTSKGFTFDYVEIANDMNIAFSKALTEFKQSKISQAAFNDILYQYYVICSRHKYELVNATHLDDYRTNYNASHDKSEVPTQHEIKQLELDYE